MHITATDLSSPSLYAPDPGSDLLQRTRTAPPHPVHELAAQHDFVMQIATHHANELPFRARWRELLAASDSPQKIYQTPEFFTVLQKTHGPTERVELLSLLRLSDSSILGVLPVRIGRRSMPFQIGPFTLGTVSVEMVTLLGSVPAVQGSAAMTEYIVAQLLEQFPTCKAVLLPSLPSDSACYRHIQQFDGQDQLSSALLGPWRECHTLPLPPSFELYLERFSSKKRYNLNRQIRQLGDLAGALRLQRIENEEQVPALAAAMRRLATPAELAPLLSEATLACTAAQGLLHSYVLYAGDTPVAAIIGTRSAHVLHVHNILVDKAHLSLSIGTSVMHLATKDVISMARFTSIDFGYGTPNSDFRSSHVLQERAQVLLFNRMKSSSLLFISYTAFLGISETAVGMAKYLIKTGRAMRKASLA